MGNCIRFKPPMEWCDDDWDSPVPEKSFSGTDWRGATATRSSAKAVKVKVSKKHLEELMSKMELEGSSARQVLVSQLLNAVCRRHKYEAQQRQWRPALQSIPELN